MPFKTDDGVGRCRNCDTNLTSGTPAAQYQRLKIIQKTVRVPASLYTMNIGAVSAYKKPTAATYGVCWNQQSDRPFPSVAKVTVPTGATSAAVSHRGSGGGGGYTQTALRPGAQTPGGIGCDIKHNSYDRYLNRLKAKGALKQQGVPVNFGGELPFNLAFPIWGGKTMKTAIISGGDCNCPGEAPLATLYKGSDAAKSLYSNITITISVGDFVYALYPGTTVNTTSTGCYFKATVIGVNGDGTFLIQFEDGITDTQDLSQLRMYYPCSASATEPSNVFVDEILNEIDNVFNAKCIYPNNEYIQTILA
jgi:hypothetical protein